jgi:anti-sigma B factor antagonist
MAELGPDTAAQLDVTIGRDPDGAPVVTVAGELDSSNAHTLATRMRSITPARPERVVFDLAGLRFMDSAGLAILVRAAAEIDTIELHEPSPIVRRLIELTGLTSVLRIVS